MLYSFPRIIVLYEDSNGATEVRDYVLHKLVLRLVVDRSAVPMEDLVRVVEPRPRRSNTKVLADLAHADEITQGQNSLVPVLDADRVCELLGLPADSLEAASVQAIKARSADPQRTYPALIDRNLESIIEAIGLCDPAVPRDRLQRALRKDRLSRDRVLQTAASAVNRHARDCLLQRVPSLANLVSQICILLPAYLPRPPNPLA